MNTHTRMHANRSSYSLWCMGFTFRQLGRETHISPPLANSCFRQNHKGLDDIVSCPLWLQRGNGSTSLRQQLQMADLCNCLLFLSPLCIHADLGRSQRQISLDWKSLKCPQASKHYYLSLESTVETIQWKDNKLWGHLGWTNTHEAGRTVKSPQTRPSWREVLIWKTQSACFGCCCWNCMNLMFPPNRRITVLASERHSNSTNIVCNKVLRHSPSLIVTSLCTTA